MPKKKKHEDSGKFPIIAIVGLREWGRKAQLQVEWDLSGASLSRSSSAAATVQQTTSWIDIQRIPKSTVDLYTTKCAEVTASSGASSLSGGDLADNTGSAPPTICAKVTNKSRMVSVVPGEHPSLPKRGRKTLTSFFVPSTAKNNQWAYKHHLVLRLEPRTSKPSQYPLKTWVADAAWFIKEINTLHDARSEPLLFAEKREWLLNSGRIPIKIKHRITHSQAMTSWKKHWGKFMDTPIVVTENSHYTCQFCGYTGKSGVKTQMFQHLLTEQHMKAIPVHILLEENSETMQSTLSGPFGCKELAKNIRNGVATAFNACGAPFSTGSLALHACNNTLVTLNADLGVTEEKVAKVTKGVAALVDELEELRKLQESEGTSSKKCRIFGLNFVQN